MVLLAVLALAVGWTDRKMVTATTVAAVVETDVAATEVVVVVEEATEAIEVTETAVVAGVVTDETVAETAAETAAGTTDETSDETTGGTTGGTIEGTTGGTDRTAAVPGAGMIDAMTVIVVSGVRNDVKSREQFVNLQKRSPLCQS